MSSYGQRAPSSSFQQDSALVAQFASHEHAERDNHIPAPEEFAAWNDTTYQPRPKKLTMGRRTDKPEARISANERSPLLPKPCSVSQINETYEGQDGRGHDSDYRHTFFDEVKTLARYTLPVFGCVSRLRFTHGPLLICIQNACIGGSTAGHSPRYLYSNSPHQYSLLVAGTVSIGHLSTKALAAATLGSMTASVTGLSIMQGFLSSLDTLLPSAWTSSNPQLVGLWCQRVCTYPSSPPAYNITDRRFIITAVVLFFLLFVSLAYIQCICVETDCDTQAYKRCMDLVRVHPIGSQTRPRSRALRRNLS